MQMERQASATLLALGRGFETLTTANRRPHILAARTRIVAVDISLEVGVSDASAIRLALHAPCLTLHSLYSQR